MDNTKRKHKTSSKNCFLLLSFVFFVIYSTFYIGGFLYNIATPVGSSTTTEYTVIFYFVYGIVAFFLVLFYSFNVSYIKKEYKKKKKIILLVVSSILFVIEILGIIAFFAAVIAAGVYLDENNPAEGLDLVFDLAAIFEYSEFFSPVVYIFFIWTFILFLKRYKREKIKKEQNREQK